MSQKSHRRKKSLSFKKNQQMPSLETFAQSESVIAVANLQPVQEETKAELVEEAPQKCNTSEAFKAEVSKFIEISKYFSSPLHKSASYICENRLVSYPSLFRLEYKRGLITTERIKFCNVTLQPVFIRLFKIVPDLEQIRFTNLSLSRCKRIPPGLTFDLEFVYDDVNEKPACNAKVIFAASRKTTTPCYQICEIELDIYVQKTRLIPK